MSKNTYKKLGKMRKKIWEGARGGILTSMVLFGAGTAFAQSVPDYVSPTSPRTPSGMHMMHRYNSPTKAVALALQLGLNPKLVKQQLKSGKPLKQILQENGISVDQLDVSL